MLTAKDIMTTDIVTVSPDQTIGGAIDVLLERQVSGAPVTEQDGTMVGIISEFALLAITYEPNARHDPVRGYMTSSVISVNEDEAVTKIVDIFITQRLRRLPVTRQGVLVGMISRRDVLRAARHAKGFFCDPAPNVDGAIFMNEPG